MNRLDMSPVIEQLRLLRHLKAYDDELFSELTAFYELLVSKQITVFNDLSESEILQFYSINHKSENIVQIKDIKMTKRLNIKLDLLRDNLIHSLCSLDSILRCDCRYCACKFISACKDNTKACFCFTHEEGCSCQKK